MLLCFRVVTQSVQPKRSYYPSQSKFPIVCVCQIVLQQLEELAGVSTVVPLYPDDFGLSASERPSKELSKISQSSILTKKELNFNMCLVH